GGAHRLRGAARAAAGDRSRPDRGDREGRRAPGDPARAGRDLRRSGDGRLTPTPSSDVALATPVRVVVADDSAFMRRLLSDALRARGFEVVGEAKDGDEALSLCRARQPDALTLDLAMPGLDGLGVLRALRETHSRVPVVVVSAFSPAQGARAVDALAEGAVEL